jgi:hypothetical protein
MRHAPIQGGILGDNCNDLLDCRGQETPPKRLANIFNGCRGMPYELHPDVLHYPFIQVPATPRF